jgi:epoxyqueuosine reductase
VEAGLGTLGLNLQLLTPEYGPRVLLTAVLCSVDVECDRPMTQALCLGPSCGRCLKACPGDTVRHWGRDWETCDEYRSPYGFAKLTGQIEKIVQADDVQARKELLRSEATFNLWQSILRGSGVITGCRRCADVCPVGADYAAMLADALDPIPEDTPGKGARLAGMAQAEARGDAGEGYALQQRWIGALNDPQRKT